MAIFEMMKEEWQFTATLQVKTLGELTVEEPIIEEDTLALIDSLNFSMVQMGVRHATNSALTRWLLNNAKDIGRRRREFGGAYVLDELINSDPLDTNFVNGFTLRTLLKAHKSGVQDYTYHFDHDFMAWFVNEEGSDASAVAERYVLHHRRFKKYLENNPGLKARLVGAGVQSLGLWEKELSYNEVYERLARHEVSPEQAPQANNKAADAQKAQANNKLKIYKPDDVSSIDEYEQNNVIQERLGKNIKSFIRRRAFDVLASGEGKTTQRGRQHLIFSGGPGTGKTSLARVMGRHLKDLGVLEKGHVVSVSAPELIGQYVGQTAPKVKAAADAAKGGILFIDEAYHFAEDDRFGADAINQLVALTGGDDCDFVMVIAGYPDDNEKLLNMNPGLKDRFTHEFVFEDFSKDELRNIMKQYVESKNLQIEPQVLGEATDYVEKLKRQEAETFANARTVQNVVEKIIDAHSDRLYEPGMALNDNFNGQASAQNELFALTAEDVRAAIQGAVRPALSKGNKVGFRVPTATGA